MKTTQEWANQLVDEHGSIEDAIIFLVDSRQWETEPIAVCGLLLGMLAKKMALKLREMPSDPK